MGRAPAFRQLTHRHPPQFRRGLVEHCGEVGHRSARRATADYKKEPSRPQRRGRRMSSGAIFATASKSETARAIPPVRRRATFGSSTAVAKPKQRQGLRAAFRSAPSGLQSRSSSPQRFRAPGDRRAHRYGGSATENDRQGALRLSLASRRWCAGPIDEPTTTVGASTRVSDRTEGGLISLEGWHAGRPTGALRPHSGGQRIWTPRRRSSERTTASATCFIGIRRRRLSCWSLT